MIFKKIGQSNESAAIEPSAAAEPEKENYNSFSFWKAPLPSFDLAGLLESLAGDSGGGKSGDVDSAAAPKQGMSVRIASAVCFCDSSAQVDHLSWTYSSLSAASPAETFKPIKEDVTVPDTMGEHLHRASANLMRSFRCAYSCCRTI